MLLNYFLTLAIHYFFKKMFHYLHKKFIENEKFQKILFGKKLKNSQIFVRYQKHQYFHKNACKHFKKSKNLAKIRQF